MTPNKKYKSINRSGLLIVIVSPESKRQFTIEFKPGYGRNAEGYYYTNDPVVQEAIENDKRFNKSFKIDKINNLSIHEYNAKTKSSKQGEVVPPTVVFVEKMFKNVNAAKDFFRADPYKVPVSKLATKALIVAKGKTLGFETKFENDLI